MTNATSNNNSQGSIPTMGTFTPYQYSGNKKDDSKPRMAGDMLNDFAKGNVAKVLGANTNKDYRNGASNESSSYQPTVDKPSSGGDNKAMEYHNKFGSSDSAEAKEAQFEMFGKKEKSSGWTDGNGKAMEESPEKAAARAAQQQQAKNKLANRASELSSSYDPAKYQYYESEFGSGTGADAYGKDMANYESWVEMNNGDGLAAGHLGLVSQMMHPDWGRSQKTGGGNPIIEQDYSKPRLSGREKSSSDWEARRKALG